MEGFASARHVLQSSLRQCLDLLALNASDGASVQFDGDAPWPALRDQLDSHFRWLAGENRHMEETAHVWSAALALSTVTVTSKQHDVEVIRRIGFVLQRIGTFGSPAADVKPKLEEVNGDRHVVAVQMPRKSFTLEIVARRKRNNSKRHLGDHQLAPDGRVKFENAVDDEKPVKDEEDAEDPRAQRLRLRATRSDSPEPEMKRRRVKKEEHEDHLAAPRPRFVYFHMPSRTSAPPNAHFGNSQNWGIPSFPYDPVANPALPSLAELLRPFRRQTKSRLMAEVDRNPQKMMPPGILNLGTLHFAPVEGPGAPIFWWDGEGRYQEYEDSLKKSLLRGGDLPLDVFHSVGPNKLRYYGKYVAAARVRFTQADFNRSLVVNPHLRPEWERIRDARRESEWPKWAARTVQLLEQDENAVLRGENGEDEIPDDDAAWDYVVLRCVGFDAEKLNHWVDRRNQNDAASARRRS